MFPQTAIPPLPPELQAQAQQQSVMPMFSQMGMAAAQPGGGISDPVSVLEAQVAELEAWTERTAPVVELVNPGLSALLVPIAQAGKALQSEIQNLKQRMAGPSPQVMGSVAPNVPGNIPGARPSM